MKFKMTPKTRRRVIVGTILTATAVPSFAIFGLGDIVFDPSQYANMLIAKAGQVEEIAKLESQLQTAIQTAETLQKSYTTAMNTYQQVQANAARFGTKSGWMTSAYRLMKQSSVQSRFGEGDGFTDALNKVSNYAGDVAWTSSSIHMDDAKLTSLMNGSPSFAVNATNGRKSQLAMVEASDAVSPACLSAIGTYSGQRASSSAAMDTLQQQQYDTNDDTNSEVEQLNMTNASLAQNLNEVQSQGALHSCIAQQMLVVNMQQRNAAAQELNSVANVASIKAASNADYSGSSYTWSHYIP